MFCFDRGFTNIPTDHPQFKGASISMGIRIDGEAQNSPEYPFDDGSIDKSYVLSKLGKKYSFVFQVRNPNKTHPDDGKSRAVGMLYPRVEIAIDGKVCVRRMWWEKGEVHVSGAASQRNTVICPFEFAAPRLVESGGLMDKKEVDSLGTIEIRICLAKFTGSGAQTSEYDLNTANIPILVHTFHYKTQDFLELDGMIPHGLIHPTKHALHAKTDDDARVSKKVKPEIASSGATSGSQRAVGGCSSSGGAAKDGDEDAVEFVSSTSRKKKVVEVIDLTED
ncbi:hypothetical protein HDU98_002506 [Podochytrium sp. JEL0797]|nr:hypothetical protein HDU98_002506 [Podochytrium sp. JEL0797]